jgi:DNA-binding IclR family transcriptional regulator
MDKVQQVAIILKLLSSRSNPCGISEISRELGINKTAIHRILKSLKQSDFVEQDPNSQKYAIGRKMIEMGASLLSHFSLRRISLPHLQSLLDITNETTALAMLIDLEGMVLDQLPSNHAIRWVVNPGKREPLWCGAFGKSMLAYMPYNTVKEVFDIFKSSETPILASGRAINVDKLNEDLTSIRTRGFALSVEERAVGNIAVASPILGYNNQVLGAISMGGPAFRFTEKLALSYGTLLSNTAEKISDLLSNAMISYTENHHS